MKQPPLDLPVNLVLPLGNVYAILSSLGKHPYEQVAPIIQSIQNQSDIQVALWLKDQKTQDVEAGEKDTAKS